MVVATKMNKPVLKVSMDSESEEDSSSTGSSPVEADESDTVEEESDKEAEGSDEEADESDTVAEESDKEAEGSDEEADESDTVAEESDKEVEVSDEEAEESDKDAEASGDVADTESGESDGNEEVLMANKGWADSIAKILGSNKPKNKKTLVLSRAKKHSDIKKIVKDEKPEFEVILDNEKGKKSAVKKEEAISLEPPPKKRKHDKPSIRVKPNVLSKDRERSLSKVATKGVVQLFNAVRNQQKTLEKEMDRNDLSESKKEKILRKFDKRAFLDTLMGQTKSIVVDEESNKTKNEIKDEDKPKWSALRDDFMMGAKMKDWDKESVDE